MITCAHCGREKLIPWTGSASVNGQYVCHPNVDWLPDCYRLVTVYGQELGIAAARGGLASAAGRVIYREFRRHLDECGCGSPGHPTIEQCPEGLRLWELQPDSYKIAWA